MDEFMQEFSRYANFFKVSTIVSVVESFSTRRPTHKALWELFSTLGRELNTLVGADDAFHVYLNPDINEIHLTACNRNNHNDYSKISANIRIPVDSADPLAWFFFQGDSPLQDICGCGHFSYQPTTKTNIDVLISAISKPNFFVVAPFCQNNIPLGYYIFAWFDSSTRPTIFLDKEGRQLREAAQLTLHYIQVKVTQILSNHFSLHRDTYLPSFRVVGPQSVAVLFADIRGSTSAYETMRLHLNENGNNLTTLFIRFFKAYLQSASEIISKPGIGRIDKFIGDGIMATFGEYVTCDNGAGRTADQNKALVSCLLAIYSSALIVDAFRSLFNHFLDSASIQDFLKSFNEVFDLDIGLGIDFGEVYFDYFGSELERGEQNSNLIGGYLEYTAVGDHVNTAQRLESIASKAISQVSFLKRSQIRANRFPDKVAPIILSRTSFLRSQPALKRTTKSIRDEFLSVVSLKGKSSFLEMYEIGNDEINGDYILRTFFDLGLINIYEKCKQHWNESRQQFLFGEDRVQELKERYLN